MEKFIAFIDRHRPRPTTWPRPAQLLSTVSATLFLLLLTDGVSGWNIWQRLFFPVTEHPADVQFWSALIYALGLVGGLPVAFLIWHWRDQNARDTIEVQRKDVLLKEFQEIQMRAAGALDEKIPEEARRTLQVAAIHQLRPFLRGEFGKSFRRPAWEILRARLQAIADEEAKMEEVYGAAARLHAERIIVGEDKDYIFRPDLPLTHANFNYCNLWGARLSNLTLTGAYFQQSILREAYLEGADLEGAHLDSADLWKAHLEGATLEWAHLKGAYMWGVYLEGADLEDAHLEGADLIRVHLEGAKLNRARLEFAKLNRAHLEGAYLEGADLEGANLTAAHLEGAYLFASQIDARTLARNTIYDDETQFTDNWYDLTEEQKAEARKPWIKRGMIHVRDLEEK